MKHKINLHKRILVSLVLISLLILSIESIADSKTVQAIFYEFNSTEKIKANLGNKSQTRIELYPHSIKEIIGEKSSYLIIHDSKGKFLYLLPKAGVGEKFTLSVVTTSGKVQDFEFKVVEGEGSTIVVSPKKSFVEEINNTDFEIKSLLNAMIKDESGKYYVRDFTVTGSKSKCHTCKINSIEQSKYAKGILIDAKLISKHFAELEIREQKVYSYDVLGIQGLVLEIKNLSKKRQIINETLFSEVFRNTIVVSVANRELLPKATSKVFIITKISGGYDA